MFKKVRGLITARPEVVMVFINTLPGFIDMADIHPDDPKEFTAPVVVAGHTWSSIDQKGESSKQELPLELCQLPSVVYFKSKPSMEEKVKVKQQRCSEEREIFNVLKSSELENYNQPSVQSGCERQTTQEFDAIGSMNRFTLMKVPEVLEVLEVQEVSQVLKRLHVEDCLTGSVSIPLIIPSLQFIEHSCQPFHSTNPFVLGMMEEEEEEEEEVMEGVVVVEWNEMDNAEEKLLRMEEEEKSEDKPPPNFNEIPITMMRWAYRSNPQCIFDTKEKESQRESSAIIIFSKDISTEILGSQRHGGHSVQGSTWDFEKTESDCSVILICHGTSGLQGSLPEPLEYPEPDSQFKDFLRTLSRQKYEWIARIFTGMIRISRPRDYPVQGFTQDVKKTESDCSVISISHHNCLVSGSLPKQSESPSERCFGSGHSQEVEVKTSIQQESSHEHDLEEPITDLMDEGPDDDKYQPSDGEETHPCKTAIVDLADECPDPSSKENLQWKITS
ncbi:hypothetical protein L210DRAFT_933213 [Boletus edulis BED1]|uniref:Uncharacterized protein n=1 Tax=Boletus edulis BED1 TaxID=1328754 RepID=A0AAD4BYL0_BOLED|nr:hypothetical protein L210DRAFT_933213 [Boletus edulis BED1]